MKIIELTNKSKPRIVGAEYKGETYVLVPVLNGREDGVAHWRWWNETAMTPAKDCHDQTIFRVGFEDALGLVETYGATLLDESVREDWEKKLVNLRHIYAQALGGFGYMALANSPFVWITISAYSNSMVSGVRGTDLVEATTRLIQHNAQVPNVGVRITRIIIPESFEDHGRIITALMKGEEIKQPYDDFDDIPF